MLSAACASTGRIACPPLQPVFNEKYNQPEIKVSGGHREEVTPVPIPNTAVKLFIANDTARATAWESRTPPGYYEKPLTQSASFRFPGGIPLRRLAKSRAKIGRRLPSELAPDLVDGRDPCSRVPASGVHRVPLRLRGHFELLTRHFHDVPERRLHAGSDVVDRARFSRSAPRRA